MIVRRPAEGSTDPFAREYADRAAPRRFADKAQPARPWRAFRDQRLPWLGRVTLPHDRRNGVANAADGCQS